jgi:hypothetical protein
LGTYATNYASIRLAGVDVVDHTTHRLELVHPDHSDVILLIYRRPIPAGKSAREVSADRIAEEMVRLNGYTVLENRVLEFAGNAAVDVASRYRADGAIWYVRQAHVVIGGLWTAFAISGPLASRAAIDTWSETMMSELLVRDS